MGYFSQHPLVKQDSPYLDDAHALVAAVARWAGESPEVVKGGGGADLTLRLHPLILRVTFGRSASSTEIDAFAAKQAGEAAPGDIRVFVLPHMPPAGIRRCEAAGVWWADLSGNARIAARAGAASLWVHVEGRPNRRTRRGRPPNVFAPKSARLTRHLLALGRPASQAELRRTTGLDPGHVSRVVKRMLQMDLLTRLDDGRLAVPEPALLLEAWADGNAFRHEVIEGHLPGRAGEERAGRLGRALAEDGMEHAFTGLPAGWAYTRFAGFRSISCYVRALPEAALLDAVGFRRDTEAPNARLLVADDAGVFDGARAASGLRCVLPSQAYVDLRREPERAEELADALRPLAASPSIEEAP